VIPRRRWILELVILAVALGIWSQQALIAGPAAALFALAIAADWMARRTYAGLAVSHRVSRRGMAIGEEAEVWLTVDNPQPWALPAVHFEDNVPEGLTVADPAPQGLQKLVHGSVVWDSFFVGPSERVSHRLTVRAVSRGRWVLGRVRVWSGDPLGWARFERYAGDRPVITVYPQLYAVPPGLLSPNQPQGERRGPPWNPPDPLRVVDIRPYQIGDPLRLIHSYATARTGILQVKRLEPQGDEHLEILMLAATAPFLWQGVDADRFEALISATASVADRYLKRGAALGLSLVGTVYGSPRGVGLPPSRGATQWARVMTALAWTLPGGGQGHDLSPSLAILVRRLHPGAHLMIFACFYRTDWGPSLRRLVQRGVQVTFVAVGPNAEVPDVSGIRVFPWTPTPVTP